MTDPVIQLANVAVLVDGRPILNVPRFTVAAGETAALVGPNGAGKTTLLHVAALLKQPDRGSVEILGQAATTANAPGLRRRLSVVFQAPLLFNVSVLANAAAGARFHGLSRAEAERRVRFWLNRFGVEHLMERKARGLSGGESARVALARAFATEPTILLLDEPFSALDAPTRAALLPALRSQLRASGASALLVTHDLEEAFSFADRIDLLEHGRIIASGSAHELIARPPSRRAAQLLGIETILEARVAGIDRTRVLLDVAPCGPRVAVCHPQGEPLLPDGIVALTLPASGALVALVDDEVPGGWNRLPGIVAAVTALPSGSRLVVETPAPFVAMIPWQPHQRSWSIGDKAIFAFAPESAHIIQERG